MPPSSTEQKSYAGAAFNALMEEETKEGVVVMLLQQFDRNRDLAAAAREMMEALMKITKRLDDQKVHGIDPSQDIEDFANAALFTARAAGITTKE